MKAVTLWQPWANYCVTPSETDPERPVKQYETRSWTTRHRGLIAIHASKRWGCDQAMRFGFPELPLGAIVGVVEIVDMWATNLVGWVSRLSDEERSLGDFSPNRYGWELANPRKLDEPIPCRGKQGIWVLDAEIEEKLMRRLELITTGSTAQ